MLLESTATKPIRLLVGSPIRKSPDVLGAFLRSLARQLLPSPVTVDYAFVDDNLDPASSALLAAFGGTILPGDKTEGDFSDAAGPTHQWTPQSMSRVGVAKNRVIELALAQNYDYLWLVDCDLILGPTTFWSLYHTAAPVACAVFWTRWQNEPTCPPLPQVWLRHPYQLDGRGQEMHGFLHGLATRQRVPVWGQGACTLYQTDVFRKGVNFTPLPDLPREGMWAGEDRHLCERATRLHVPMWADAWPDIFHVYHDRDRLDVAAWEDRLATVPDGPPRDGHLVSLLLQPLEPVPIQGGGVSHLPQQHVRGEVQRLPIAREITDAVQEMRRGESRIVKIEYPMWSLSPLRGQRRLMDVTLVDHKPFALPVGI